MVITFCSIFVCVFCSLLFALICYTFQAARMERRLFRQSIYSSMNVFKIAFSITDLSGLYTQLMQIYFFFVHAPCKHYHLQVVFFCGFHFVCIEYNAMFFTPSTDFNGIMNNVPLNFIQHQKTTKRCTQATRSVKVKVNIDYISLYIGFVLFCQIRCNMHISMFVCSWFHF